MLIFSSNQTNTVMMLIKTLTLIITKLFSSDAVLSLLILTVSIYFWWESKSIKSSSQQTYLKKTQTPSPIVQISPDNIIKIIGKKHLADHKILILWPEKKLKNIDISNNLNYALILKTPSILSTSQSTDIYSPIITSRKNPEKPDKHNTHTNTCIFSEIKITPIILGTSHYLGFNSIKDLNLVETYLYSPYINLTNLNNAYKYPPCNTAKIVYNSQL